MADSLLKLTKYWNELIQEEEFKALPPERKERVRANFWKGGVLADPEAKEVFQKIPGLASHAMKRFFAGPVDQAFDEQDLLLPLKGTEPGVTSLPTDRGIPDPLHLPPPAKTWREATDRLAEVPLLGSPFAAGKDIGEGARQIFSPRPDVIDPWTGQGETRLGGVTKGIMGGFKALEPVIAGGLVGAPMHTAKTLAIAAGLGYGGEKVVEELGGPPDVAQFVGAASAFGAGAVGGWLTYRSKFGLRPALRAVEAKIGEGLEAAKAFEATGDARSARVKIAEVEGHIKGREALQAEERGTPFLMALKEMAAPTEEAMEITSPMAAPEVPPVRTPTQIETPTRVETPTRLPVQTPAGAPPIPSAPSPGGLQTKLQAIRNRANEVRSSLGPPATEIPPEHQPTVDRLRAIYRELILGKSGELSLPMAGGRTVVVKNRINEWTEKAKGLPPEVVSKLAQDLEAGGRANLDEIPDLEWRQFLKRNNVKPETSFEIAPKEGGKSEKILLGTVGLKRLPTGEYVQVGGSEVPPIARVREAQALALKQARLLADDARLQPPEKQAELLKHGNRLLELSESPNLVQIPLGGRLTREKLASAIEGKVRRARQIDYMIGRLYAAQGKKYEGGELRRRLAERRPLAPAVEVKPPEAPVKPTVVAPTPPVSKPTFEASPEELASYEATAPQVRGRVAALQAKLSGKPVEISPTETKPVVETPAESRERDLRENYHPNLTSGLQGLRRYVKTLDLEKTVKTRLWDKVTETYMASIKEGSQTPIQDAMKWITKVEGQQGYFKFPIPSKASGFYSTIQMTIRRAPKPKMPASEWLAYLKKNVPEAEVSTIEAALREASIPKPGLNKWGQPHKPQSLDKTSMARMAYAFRGKVEVEELGGKPRVESPKLKAARESFQQAERDRNIARQERDRTVEKYHISSPFEVLATLNVNDTSPPEVRRVLDNYLEKSRVLKIRYRELHDLFREEAGYGGRARYQNLFSDLPSVKNYREILLRESEVSPTAPIYQAPHYSEKGQGLLGDVSLADVEHGGKKYLIMIEAQSDRHRMLKKLEKELGRTPTDEEIRKTLFYPIEGVLYGEEIEGFNRARELDPYMGPMEHAEFKEDLLESYAIVQHPLLSSWKDRLAQVVLREAAKGNYDGILLTPGAKVSERWSEPDWPQDLYDKQFPSIFEKVGKSFGVEVRRHGGPSFRNKKEQNLLEQFERGNLVQESFGPYGAEVGPVIKGPNGENLLKRDGHWELWRGVDTPSTVPPRAQQLTVSEARALVRSWNKGLVEDNWHLLDLSPAQRETIKRSRFATFGSGIREGSKERGFLRLGPQRTYKAFLQEVSKTKDQNKDTSLAAKDLTRPIPEVIPSYEYSPTGEISSEEKIKFVHGMPFKEKLLSEHLKTGIPLREGEEGIAGFVSPLTRSGGYGHTMTALGGFGPRNRLTEQIDHGRFREKTRDSIGLLLSDAIPAIRRENIDFIQDLAQASPEVEQLFNVSLNALVKRKDIYAAYEKIAPRLLQEAKSRGLFDPKNAQEMIVLEEFTGGKSLAKPSEIMGLVYDGPIEPILRAQYRAGRALPIYNSDGALRFNPQKYIGAPSAESLVIEALGPSNKPTDLHFGVPFKLPSGADAIESLGRALSGPLKKVQDLAREQFREAYDKSYVSDPQKVKGDLREMLGERTRRASQLDALLEPEIKRWDKIGNPETFKDFTRRLERGTYEGDDVDPKDTAISRTLRQLLDDRRDQIRALGEDKLDEYIENYFPHIWQRPKEAKNWIFKQDRSRTPLEGSTGWLRKRELQFIEDGMLPKSQGGPGLTPLTYNPVTMALLRIHQLDKFITSHKMFQQLDEQGFMRWVKKGQPVPEGYDQIDDRIFRAYRYAKLEKGGSTMVPVGQWVAPKQVAGILNRYLRPGFREEGGWFQTIRRQANTLNMAQLGLSGFHFTFVSNDAAVTDAAIALGRLAEGFKKIAGEGQEKDLLAGLQEFRKALGPALRSIVPYASGVQSWIRGNAILKSYLKPEVYQRYADLADMVAQSNMSVGLDPLYKNDGIARLTTEWKKGPWKELGTIEGIKGTLGLPLKLIPAFYEYVGRPLMEFYVPRVKLGAFANLAELELSKLPPNASHALKAKTLAKVADVIEDRMGQLNYDNLDMSRKWRDALLILMRAPGWNIGSYRVFKGGFTDIAKALTGGGLSPQAAYLIMLPLITALHGSYLYMLMHKGETPPEGLLEKSFPRSGRVTPAGYPERIMDPSYLKEMAALAQGQSTVGSVVSNAVEMASGKINPIIAIAQGIVFAQESRGNQVWSPDDELYTIAKDMLKWTATQYNPISGAEAFVAMGLNKLGADQLIGDPNKPFKLGTGNAGKILNNGGSIPAALVATLLGKGIPAPQYVGMSNAEAMAQKEARHNFPQGPKTMRRMEHLENVRLLETRLINKTADWSDVIRAIDRGEIAEADEPKIEEAINDPNSTNPLVRQVIHLGLESALKVWAVANPEERTQIKDPILKKEHLLKNFPRDERAILTQKFLEVDRWRLGPMP